MAALTVDFRDVPYQGDPGHSTREGRVIASDIIYRNSLLAFAAAGGIQPVVGDLAFAGIALDQVDNSAGALGTKRVRYLAEGAVRFTGVAGFAATDEGVLVYCATDNPADLTVTSTGATTVGTILEVVSATEIVVELAGPGA